MAPFITVANGNLKIPQEQYDEVVSGKGDLVEWLKAKEKRDALLLPGAVDQALVAKRDFATPLRGDFCSSPTS